MIKEAIGTGATLEEANENAQALLRAQLPEDALIDISFDILDMPKKKTLGLFGGSPARVRAFVELPDPKPEKPARAPKPKAEKKADKPAALKADKPAKAEKPAPKAPKAEKKVEAKAEETFAAPVEVNYIDADKLDANSPVGRACAYLANVFSKMGLTGVVIRAGEIEGGHQIDLSGADLGVVIGRRGETLDALQYLASLAANNGDSYTRIVLNTGNYREKRAETLQSLANRIASQVLRTGRSRSLEPMNPYERRVIHTAVQGIEGVTSNSIGDGASRRVVISPVGGSRGGNGGRGGYGRDRRDSGRGGRGSRGRSSAPQPVSTRAPKSDIGDTPLYGKIVTGEKKDAE